MLWESPSLLSGYRIFTIDVSQRCHSEPFAVILSAAKNLLLQLLDKQIPRPDRKSRPSE